jgi:hypothetical protein
MFEYCTEGHHCWMSVWVVIFLIVIIVLVDSLRRDSKKK